jgi:peptidyl-prolyl cis-trans isomerase C
MPKEKNETQYANEIKRMIIARVGEYDVWLKPLVDATALNRVILAKIQKGEVTFQEAAKVYSSCPSSERGGDLGEFGRGQMVPEFDKACFEMEEGETRGPIQTQFGFHLIYLEKKNEAKPLSFEAVKAQLHEKLLSEAQQKAYQSKMTQLRILYPVDMSGIL